jgi:hypothetical protein
VLYVPLKVETRVRIPLGLPIADQDHTTVRCHWRVGDGSGPAGRSPPLTLAALRARPSDDSHLGRGASRGPSSPSTAGTGPVGAICSAASAVRSASWIAPRRGREA